MRNSKALAKIRAGEPVRFAYITHYVPPFLAAAARTGYDAVWLDLEHHPMDQREIQALLAFSHLYDIDVMVRPGTKEKTPIYRLLEDGATGLMMPHIHTADDARQLIDAAKFPPVGDRGIEGFGLESNYFLDIKETTFELVDHALRETFVIMQIETPEALANVEEIAATPGVDGLYIGPFDLTTRLQQLPADQRPPLQAVMERVAAAAQANNIPWGSFTLGFEQIKMQRALGAQLLIWGGDMPILIDGVKACYAELDTVID